MKQRALLLGLTAIAAITATSIASAEIRPGFYIGASAGTVEVDDDVLVDDGDTGFKVFAGYTLNDILSVEVSYIDGGTAEGSFSDIGVNAQSEVDTSIVNLSVLGDLVLTEQFSVFGRIGYAFIDTDRDLTLQFSGLPANRFSQSDSDDRVSYGVGAVYRFNEQFEARAEFEGFDVKQGDLMALTAGVLFRF